MIIFFFKLDHLSDCLVQKKTGPADQDADAQNGWFQMDIEIFLMIWIISNGW